jgi:membrane-associated phospholipid phosphatase
MPFLSIQLIFVVSIIIILLNFNKIEAHLWVNQYHNTFFDFLFYILTQSVEFWGCLSIYIIVALVKKYKYGIIGLLTYAISGIITQILKRNIFSEFNRPTYSIENLRLIPDYFEFEQHQHFSFPSGHATAAFSLFIFLTLISKNKKLGYLYAVLACLTAFSRVYLSQHYFIDILIGSLIGTIVTLFTFYLLNFVKFGKWGNKNLLSSFS